MNKTVTIKFIFSTIVVLSLLTIAILIAIFTYVYADLQRDFIDAKFESVLLQHAEAIDNEILHAHVNLLRLKDFVTTFEQSSLSFGDAETIEILETLMAQNLQFDKNHYNSYFAFEKPKAQKYFGQDGYVYTVHKDPSQLDTEAYGQPENRIVEVFTDPAYQTNPDEVWYHIAKRSQNIELSPIYYDATYMKTWLYTVGIGFYEDEVFQGMVGVDILVDSFFKAVESAKIGETGGLFLVDSESGLVLTKVGASSDNRSKILDVQERLEFNLYDSEESRSLWQPILENDVEDDVSQMSVVGDDGQTYLVSSKRLSQLPVTVVAYGTKRELLSALYRNLFIFITIGFVLVAGLIFISVLFARKLTVPINDLITTMETVKEQRTTQLATPLDNQADRVRAPISGTVETRKLGGFFNSMIEQLEESFVTLEQRVEERTVELQESIAEREQLQQQVIEAQQQALLEISTPVIPIMDQIIVMPLIGSIDSMRARDVTRSLLAGISAHRAKVVILDVTGVSIMDTGIVNHLNKTIQAARLKGAHTIVTGISDAVAEAIVDLGIDWGEITTLSDLRTGLVTALESLGIRLSTR